MMAFYLFPCCLPRTDDWYLLLDCYDLGIFIIS